MTQARPAPRIPDEVRAVLEQMKAAMPAPSAFDVETFRARAAAPAGPAPAPPGLVIEDRSVEGPGGDLAVRLYRPAKVGSPPLILFFHGGGFILGGLESHDALCRRLALETESAVCAVDYRLAPEHPFPAAIDDGYAALLWAAAHGPSLGVDVSRLTVAGDSAGATLAAGVALMVRDRRGPGLFLQVLLVPMLRHRALTPSRQAFGQGEYGITAELLNWYSDLWAPGTAADHPYAAPLHAPSLEGLPPAYIHTAELDPLLDDGSEYAARLQAAGIPVIYRVARGLFHGFHFYADTLQSAGVEVAAACGEIKRLLRRPSEEVRR